MKLLVRLGRFEGLGNDISIIKRVVVVDRNFREWRDHRRTKFAASIRIRRQTYRLSGVENCEGLAIVIVLEPIRAKMTHRVCATLREDDNLVSVDIR